MRHHSSLLAGRKEHDPVLKEDVIPSAPPVAVPPMMDETFECFQSFIEENLGIKLPPAKKIMLEARLARRVHKARKACKARRVRLAHRVQSAPKVRKVRSARRGR